jgi:hypothetical protein
MLAIPPEHASEVRRCLLESDLPGLLRVWAHVAPHLCELTPRESMIAMHMARCEAKRMPRKLKEYSQAWLAEIGVTKFDGRWVQGPPPTQLVSGSVGISSKSNDPGFAKKIVTAMEDALLNAMAKGVEEPPMQKEAMLKARDKVRFKHRRI